MKSIMKNTYLLAYEKEGAEQNVWKRGKKIVFELVVRVISNKLSARAAS